MVNKRDSREQYTFPCRQWLAKDEGDGKISRTLVAQGTKHADHDDSSKGAHTALATLSLAFIVVSCMCTLMLVECFTSVACL